ncbi:MAG: hypothetical protein JRE40_01770 [Deltaproteobacteria bacterium]|nr:hypothetical protein [Deltaproteobacteria bacterium]
MALHIEDGALGSKGQSRNFFEKSENVRAAGMLSIRNTKTVSFGEGGKQRFKDQGDKNNY